ncbi:TetR/AcrR family transcriptional regulator [Glutamicibacter sp.]|uniref:TetR/AcrR family transcriptional regulator n=1 Tax=Glutamicibacter sp. TaxID=1931995 RepID=UPI002B489EA2|nr:TetR/AcrR family transcriptional regulator [Glutamicibacter sp.]HJX77154.1 TetR/AcrR family transcriptional regulator [Glutamicibacter sp.]
MARTLAFDRTQVINGARTVFWSKGFEAASIPELEDATGLSRSSIYNSFASKRGLFDAAVESYLEEIVRPRLQPLLSTPVKPTAVSEYLSGLANAFERTESLPANHGCLLINTANAPISEDPEVARIIGEYRAELQSALHRGITAALPAVDAAQTQMLATAITGLVVASFTLVRIAPDEAVQLLRTAQLLLDDED